MAREQVTTSRPPAFEGAFDVVALASSAGGLRALTAVLTPLPADFPAAILIVHHLDPHHQSLMAKILARCTRLQVSQAEEGEPVAPGRIRIAPPDWHMLLTSEGKISLSHSGLLHFVRPSADHLFQSAAENYGQRAIGVVLTGGGRDGSVGAQAVKRCGGIVIAQDQATSEVFGMPGAAIATGAVDLVLPLQDIASTLIRLVTRGPNDDERKETREARRG